MTPTRCLTAAMLEVGMRHEASLSFSREEVARLIRGGIVEMQIAMADPEGNRIGEATAKVVAPDAAYRAWWEANIDSQARGSVA
jgi:hypothetical protein